MKKVTLAAIALIFTSLLLGSCSKAEPGKVYIVSPKNGGLVDTTFTVIFGTNGVEVVPAGDGNGVDSGHHHLIVNGELPDLTKPLGGDVMHFGKGQVEVELTLPAGEHTLQLVLGDKAHTPGKTPVYSEKITVTVIDE